MPLKAAIISGMSLPVSSAPHPSAKPGMLLISHLPLCFVLFLGFFVVSLVLSCLHYLQMNAVSNAHLGEFSNSRKLIRQFGFDCSAFTRGVVHI